MQASVSRGAADIRISARAADGGGGGLPPVVRLEFVFNKNITSFKNKA